MTFSVKTEAATETIAQTIESKLFIELPSQKVVDKPYVLSEACYTKYGLRAQHAG